MFERKFLYCLSILGSILICWTLVKHKVSATSLSHGDTINISGVVARNWRGDLGLQTNDGKHYLLFDEMSKSKNTIYLTPLFYLEEDLLSQMISARKRKKTVKIAGQVYEAAGMPRGVLIKEISFV